MLTLCILKSSSPGGNKNAAEPRSFTVDTKNPQNSPLMSVGYPGDSSFQRYGAILAVADDVVLPQYSPGQAQEEAESNALMDQRNQSRRHDPVGNRLEALADHAQSQYGNVATIVRSSERSAVTVKPHNADSAAIYWSRSDQYDDGILASVGDGTWELSASVSDAGLVAEFLAAAAAGHVEERVRHGTNKTKYLATEITTADGRVWADSAEFETFDMEEGTFAVAGELWDRFEKGDHKYQAWGW